ncbi:methylase [Metallosphaera tengchongensis]|uniref:Methylase n=1 Tax=Metallosphaera tengchongensis TaxID=1532350 RepID=A0A6N0NSR5_9CREN|nr:methylase [Metallosphaera tengchongensis]QKQ99146.1 methylase [Metallosphaera tengchongensis]
MSLTFLIDDKEKISPLWRSLSFISVNGRIEVINASMGRTSVLPAGDVLIGRDMLRGEMDVLSMIYPFVVNNQEVVRYHKTVADYPQLQLRGRKLGVGWCDEDFVACISKRRGENVISLHPFPFKDEVFDYVLIYEILDYDLVREAYRVTKKGGKLMILIRDEIFGGVKPSIALKFMVKFQVSSVSLKGGFWVIEGVKGVTGFRKK